MTDEGATATQPGATVLVVDDEPKVTDLYVEYLQDTYETIPAYGPEEALERVDDYVDVVLLDRRMPETSGDEVLAEIRDAEYDVRVVMITALDPDFDIVDMAFDNYVCKPVSGDDLREAVETELIHDSYDSRLEEYLRVTKKLSVLKDQKSQQELDESDRYTELKMVARSLREDLQSMIEEHEELEEEDRVLP